MTPAAASAVPDAASMWSSNDRALEMARAVLGSADAPVGLTPKELIWRKNKARLYRYVRSEPATHRTPIFLVLPLINRAYILDLRPGASFVEFLLGEGHRRLPDRLGHARRRGSGARRDDARDPLSAARREGDPANHRRRADDGTGLLHRRRAGDLLHGPPSRGRPEPRPADGAARLLGRRSVRPDDGARRLPDRPPDRHVPDGARTDAGRRARSSSTRWPTTSAPIATSGRSWAIRHFDVERLAGDVPLGERQRPVRRRGIPAVDRRVLPGEPAVSGHARDGRPARSARRHPLPGPQYRGQS